jgi:hypothetical protein
MVTNLKAEDFTVYEGANCANSKIENTVTLSLGIWDDYALTGRRLKDPKPWLAPKSHSR